VQIEGLLLDIDGVLAISWEPIPGSIEALAAFRRAQIPICLITNTTTHTRAGLAQILGDAGCDIEPSEIVTAVTATADYVRVVSVQRMTGAGLRGIAETIVTLAQAEGLTAHARSIELRTALPDARSARERPGRPSTTRTGPARRGKS